jgi:hypothetical protein
MNACREGHEEVQYEAECCPMCRMQDAFERAQDALNDAKDAFTDMPRKAAPPIKKEGKLIEFPKIAYTKPTRKKLGRVLPISSDSAS